MTIKVKEVFVAVGTTLVVTGLATYCGDKLAKAISGVTPVVIPEPCTAPASEFQKTRFINPDKAIQNIAVAHGLTMPKAPAFV